MRTKSSVLNLTVAMAGQIIGLLVSFFTRITFIQILGTEYLGLNGLFTNILSILSLVELGIGPAMSFSLYKPLAEKDTEKVKSLMRLFKRAYISVGVAILILGISFTPFLDKFIKSIPDIPHIQMIFLLFVLNSAISYFYSYKRSLIMSDQKRYIATIYRYSFFVALNLVQIIMLFLTHSFILFLVCQIIATLSENILVSRKADSLYPYLKEKDIQKLDRLTIQQISKNIRAMIAHKLGGVVVGSTDSLIISKFVGLVELGMYTNYQLIINALSTVFSQIFTSITASIGNLGATETNSKKVSIFNIVLFINFWIYSFASICLVILINPFIEIWIGKEYVLNMNIIIIVILNFYLTGMRMGIITFRDALGVYWYDRHKPIFESLINLIASIILVKQLGIMGVFIGTTISTVLTCLWVEPYVLYKYGFRSSVFPFFKRYILYGLLTILAGLMTMCLTNTISGSSLIAFAIKLLICIVVPNGIYLLLFHKTSEFKYITGIIRQYTKKIRIKMN